MREIVAALAERIRMAKPKALRLFWASPISWQAAVRAIDRQAICTEAYRAGPVGPEGPGLSEMGSNSAAGAPQITVLGLKLTSTRSDAPGRPAKTR